MVVGFQNLWMQTLYDKNTENIPVYYRMRSSTIAFDELAWRQPWLIRCTLQQQQQQRWRRRQTVHRGLCRAPFLSTFQILLVWLFINIGFYFPYSFFILSHLAYSSFVRSFVCNRLMCNWKWSIKINNNNKYSAILCMITVHTHTQWSKERMRHIEAYRPLLEIFNTQSVTILHS